MKAYITSIGEPTTKICKWALERNQFEVEVIESDSSLQNKLKAIYEKADSDFLRVDADVVVNKNCHSSNIEFAAKTLEDAWWVQFQCWGWYSQDLIYGGVQYIKKEALPYLVRNVDEAAKYNRPETYLSRIKEFYEPRRFQSYNLPMGIHGYGIKDLKKVVIQKANRGQSHNYDFELATELNKL